MTPQVLPQDNPELRKFYQNLQAEYELPDYKVFEKTLSSEKGRADFYKNLGETFDLPDYNTFERTLGFGKKKSPTSESPFLASSTAGQSGIMQKKPSDVPSSPLAQKPTQKTTPQATQKSNKTPLVLSGQPAFDRGVNMAEVAQETAKSLGKQQKDKEKMLGERNFIEKAIDSPLQALQSGVTALGSGATGLIGGLSSSLVVDKKTPNAPFLSNDWFLNKFASEKSENPSFLSNQFISDNLLKVSKGLAEVSSGLMKTARVGAGVDSDKGAEQLLEEGNIVDGAKSLVLDVVQQIPNMVALAYTGGGTQAFAGAGALAAGSNISQQYSEDGDISSEDLARSIAVGIVEGTVGRIFNGNEKALAGLIKGSLPQISRTVKDVGKQMAIGTGENTIEEAIITTLSTVANKAGTGTWDDKAKEKLIADIKQSMLVGGASGFAMGGVAAVGAFKPFTKEEKAKIQSYQEVLDSESATPKAKVIAQQRIDQINLGKSQATEARYDALMQLPLEDRAQIITLDREVADTLDEIELTDNVEIKNQLKAEIEAYEAEINTILQKQATPETDVTQEVVAETEEFQGAEVQGSRAGIDAVSEVTNRVIEQSDKIQEIESRMNSAELIDEKDINSATDELYVLLDEIDKLEIKPEVKEGIVSAIENKIKKLEGYEFETTSQVVEPGQTKSVSRGVKIIGTTTRGSKSKNEVTGERLDKKSVSVVDGATGKTIDGSFTLKDGKIDVVDAKTKKTKVFDTGRVTYQQTNLDDNGVVQSVTLLDPVSGDSFTINDPDIALDLSIQEKTKQLGEITDGVLEEVIQEVEVAPKVESVIKDKQVSNKAATNTPAATTPKTTAPPISTPPPVVPPTAPPPVTPSSGSPNTNPNATYVNPSQIKERLDGLMMQPETSVVGNRIEQARSKLASGKNKLGKWLADKLSPGPKKAVIVAEKIESLKGQALTNAKKQFDALADWTKGDKAKRNQVNDVLSLGNLDNKLSTAVADNNTALSILTDNKYTPEQIKDAMGADVNKLTKEQKDIFKSLAKITPDKLKEAKKQYNKDVKKLVGEYLNRNEFTKASEALTVVSPPQKQGLQKTNTTDLATSDDFLTTLGVSEARSIQDIEADIKNLPQGDKIIDMIKQSIDARDKAVVAIKAAKGGRKALAAAEQARKMMDDLSDYIAYSPSAENIPERVGVAARGGKGYYLKRTFQYWKDKGFTVDKQVKEAALLSIQETAYATGIGNVLKSKEYKDADADGKKEIIENFNQEVKDYAKQELNEYIDRNRLKKENKKVSGSVSITQHRVDAKQLKERGVIDEAFLELLGNTDDAVSQFLDTIMAQTQIQAATDLQYVINNSFGENVIYDNYEKLIKERETSEGFKEITDKNGVMAGKWVRDDIADVLKLDHFIPEGPLLNFYFKGLSGLRKVKTTYNPASYPTNQIGGIFNWVANGIFANPASVIKTIGSQVSNMISPNLSSSKRVQDLKERMQAVGVWNTSISAQSIIALNENSFKLASLDMNSKDYKDASKAVLDTFGNNVKVTDDKILKAYAGIDDFSKMVFFDAKTDIFANKLYGDDYQNLQPDQKRRVDEELGERVKQNMPTASRLPKAYNSIVKLPFGDFLGFRVAAAQSAGYTIINAASDLVMVMNKSLSPKQRMAYLKDAVSTISGMSLVAYAGQSGWQALVNLLSDDEDEKQDKDKRSLNYDLKSANAVLPNWMRGKNIVALKIDKDGNVLAGNISNKDPYDEPFGLLFGREGANRWDVVKGILSEVSSPNMLVQLIEQVVGGTDAFGRKIYDEDQTDKENFVAIVKYIVEKTILPPSPAATFNQSKKDAILAQIKKDGNMDIYEEATNKEKKKMEKEAEDNMGTFDILNESPKHLSTLAYRNYDFNMFDQFGYAIRDEMKDKKQSFNDLDEEGKKERFKDLQKIREGYVFLERFNEAYPDSKSAESIFEKASAFSRMTENEKDFIKFGVKNFESSSKK